MAHCLLEISGTRFAGTVSQVEPGLVADYMRDLKVNSDSLDILPLRRWSRRGA